MTNLTDREGVRHLHQAYADHTQAVFEGLRGIPGDPFQVRLRSFGTARTLIANGHDWTSRATLTGDEPLEIVDDVIRYFAEQGQRCLVEWNPGNCYRGGKWDDSLGRHLLARGFVPGGFRCVWAGETSAASIEPHGGVDVRGYGPSELDEYLEELGLMHGHDEAKRAETRANVLHGEGDDRWRHYIGRIESVPCCDAMAFFGEDVAYLGWGGTLEACRGRGCHAALIRRRLADARENGCERAFAVTDVGVPSARNLQRAGLRLAYNYVMLSREPSPLA